MPYGARDATRWSALGAAILVAGAACADGPAAAGATHAVRDSAGVEIVESARPAWTEETAWRIRPEPVVEIGSVDGDPAEAFQSVHDATRFPDGRVAVVEWGTAEIRVFGADGRHLTTFGGYGQGPSEFGTTPFLAQAADTLLVWDGIGQRLTRFDLDGNLLTEASYPHILQEHGVMTVRGGLGWTVASDGSLLASAPRRPGRGEGLQARTQRVVLFGPDGALAHEFGTFTSSESFMIRHGSGGLRGIANAFAPSVVVALGPGALPVTIAEGPGWEVRRYAPDGRLGRILRAAIPRLPVTDELLDQERADFPRVAEDMQLTLRQVEEAFEQIPVPDSVPAIGLLRWSRDGRLWVARRARRIWDLGSFDVLEADGRWLGTVVLPPGNRKVLEVGPDYILTEGLDELDVPYVRVYAVEHPRG